MGYAKRRIGLILTAVLGVFLFHANARAADADTVTVASFGGLVLDAEAAALFADSKKLGIELRKERHGGWPGIKAHLLTGAPGWDIISIGSARCEIASQMNLLMPVDYSIVKKDDLPPDMLQPNYVKAFTFSYGIVYQKSKYGDHPPQNWVDFWDVKKFPGRRALEGEGLYALEAALIADGVDPKDVYKVLKAPGGVDRAFKKLAELKPNITVWLDSVGQAMQVVHDGEVDMAIMSNGRVLALIQDGVKIGFVWNQAFMDYECYMVPKNAPHPKLAMEMLNSALDAKNQADFSNLVKYGAGNPKSFTLGIIAPDVIPWLSTAPQNIDKQILADPTWYASPAADEAYKRFQQFKTQ